MPVMGRSKNLLTGQPLSTDVMISPMTAVGGAGLTDDVLRAVKDEAYRRYIARFFALPASKTNPTPMATVASGLTQGAKTTAAPALDSRITGLPPGSNLAGLASFFGFGKPKDIELPNEAGVRDPRLGPGSLLDTLKMSKETAKRLLKEKW